MITTPELNTYGPYARASMLADYVELLALKGQSVKRAILADFLADNDWDLQLIEQPVDVGSNNESKDLSEQLDEANEISSVVFRQINERRDVLAHRYPFEITDDAIAFDCGTNREANPYAAMLALTIAHAFSVHTAHRPDEMFEQTVLTVLQARGLSSSGVAVHRRGGKSFDESLRIACEDVGLKAAPDAAPKLAYAHDEGVDILCHFGWEKDLRPGTWGFIGQVTVGRSDSWDKKIKEPSPNQWKLFVSSWVPPSPFLAVPHHVERPTMERLTSKSGAIVLDRLRLVGFKDEVDAGERDLIKAVLGEDVEPLTG